MKTKKNRDYDLERLRTPLTFLGLLFASALTLTLLEWRTPIKTIQESSYERPVSLTDEVIFTAIPERVKKPPKPIQKPVIDELILVDKKEKQIDLFVPDMPIEEPQVQEIAPFKEKVTEEAVVAPDVKPEFPGGMAALRSYLRTKLNYPIMARQAGVQGVVWVEFIVSKKGEITDVHILRGIGAGCDREALRVVSQMPNWKPGRQHGLPVKVRFQLPISFRLRN